MVVGVVGIGDGGALEEGDGVTTLAAGGDGLIVDDFGEGETAGDEGEGRLGFGVFRSVETGEADVEVCFESTAVGWGDFGEGSRGLIVVALGELSFAESEERGGIVGGNLDGGLEALDALLRGGCIGAADVVLEGAELDIAGCGEKGLLGYGKVGIDLAGDLPGDGVLEVEEAREFCGVGQRL